MFETSDFYLACFLRCTGYDLVEVRRDGARVIFIFNDKHDRRDTVLAFYNNHGSVAPLSFAGVIKDMKSLIHNI